MAHYIFYLYSYKFNWSDDIHGGSGIRGHHLVPVCGYSEVHNQKRAAHGENPFSIYTQRVPSTSIFF